MGVHGGNISFDLGGGDWEGDADSLNNFFGTSSSAPHIAARVGDLYFPQSSQMRCSLAGAAGWW